MFDAVAESVDPDLSYLSEATGVPRATIHKWMQQRAEAGDLMLERNGRRKIVVIDDAVPHDIVKLMDFMVERLTPACPNCGHRIQNG